MESDQPKIENEFLMEFERAHGSIFYSVSRGVWFFEKEDDGTIQILEDLGNEVPFEPVEEEFLSLNFQEFDRYKKFIEQEKDNV